MIAHGGRVREAAYRQGIALERWLDLSTGISPYAYPVRAVPLECWRRLPDGADDLIAAARRYYGARHVLPVAGTQAAIQVLPRLRAPCRVVLPALTYAEHAHAWARHGHDVRRVAWERLDDAIGEADVLVVVNPNNPTGAVVSVERLQAWYAKLAARGGWLVIDEAYVDVEPVASMASLAGVPGLVVLRSLGKFFGLAGARVGFVLTEPRVLDALEEELGPWHVSNPAQHVATRALNDAGWQAAARARLLRATMRLHDVLARRGIETCGTALFRWWADSRAPHLHAALMRNAVLTRLFDEDAGVGVRFGLPGADEQWAQLEEALDSWR